jgi:sugar diacid utilization regulator
MNELQRLAERLAADLGRSVAIDDTNHNLICHTAHDEAVDEHRMVALMKLRVSEEIVAHIVAHGVATAEGPVRVSGVPQIGLLARLCVPLRFQGELLGYLWIIEPDGGLSDEQVEAAVTGAAEASQLLHRLKLMDDLADSRERELLRDLVSVDAGVSAAAAQLLVDDDMLPSECSLAVLTLQVRSEDREDLRMTVQTALRRVGRRSSPLVALSMALAGGRGVLLLAGRSAPTSGSLLAAGEQVRDELVKALGSDAEVRVAIGPVVPGPTQAAESAARARETLSVISAVSDFGTVVAWDDLGVYRFLVQLPLADLPETGIPENLRALLAQDSDGVLLKTLETWLDEGTDVRRSVAHLSVHRTSLYYRLGRVEEITGLSLDDGRNRLSLHLGLKLARLKGMIPGRS